MEAGQAVEEMFAEIQPNDMRLRRVSRVGNQLTVHFDAISDGKTLAWPVRSSLECIVEMLAPLSDTDDEVQAWPADNIRKWAYYAVYVRIMELFWTGRLIRDATYDPDGTLRYVIPAAGTER
ncbi:hypothetical protein DZF95_00820 [Clavibacter michiganensis]|nr:hypothetical protein DZF95_00820 [Clavibacter michiganensis]